MMNHWLLALDVGTNSTGWWAYAVDKGADGRWQIVRSLDGGVRLFPDGREPAAKGRVGDSLAVNRRIARGMRRNRERRQLRMRRLVDTLISVGLLPADEATRSKLFQTPAKKNGDPDAYNPYRLRAEAVEGPLDPHALGRALFHLGLRRGYLSNRKEASDEDGGKLKDRMSALEAALEGRTLGQYLWQQLKAEQQTETPAPIRFSDGNPLYSSRAMYRRQFEQIRTLQAPHHSLSDTDWDTLATLILEQRPLKPVERGRCEFFPHEPRHWKDAPAGHDFRIYQELNNLRLVDPDSGTLDLTKDQYDTVLNLLMTQKTVSFGAMRKSKDRAGNRLFPAGSTFNLESHKRKHLNGHSIAVDMQKDPALKRLWDQHHESGTLDALFEVLFDAENDAEARDTLVEQFSLDAESASALARLKLARATSGLSLKAMQQLVSIMRDQGLQYWDAVTELHDEDGNRLHHSRRELVRFDRLPYYGAVLPEYMLGAHPDSDPEQNPEMHFGRINNPTVHVALNQLRKLVNTLTDRFGAAPVKVHVELARELKRGKKSREEVEKQQAQNEKRNADIRKRLREEFNIAHPSATDIKKWRLWEELGRGGLDRRCIFTGQSIAGHQLFNGEVEIEHILPFSRTLDNSISNLTLSFRWANALKGNKTPHEAFASGTYAHKGIAWQDIIERARTLPVNKVWRFGENAMERFERENDFIARQLTDTAYMARITARYLKALEGVEDIVTLPGTLTAMVRGKWRLNGILSGDAIKTREDHRHHAVDAAVIGLIDRSLLHGISTLSKRATDEKVHIRIPPLDPKLEDSIRARVPSILPSFKPDHSLEGKMFKETAYGFIDRDKGLLVTRKALSSLTPKEVGMIRDDDIRRAVERTIAANPAKKLDKLLAEFGAQHGIKRVRICVLDKTVNPVPSAPYKGYKADSYICCDIWAVPPKKKGGEATYEGTYWTYHEVNQDAEGQPSLDKNIKKPHPAARYITRVFKDDLIEVGPQGAGDIYRVAGFSTTNNKLDVRDPCLSETKQAYKSINQLAAEGLRRLYVTPDGRILHGGKK